MKSLSGATPVGPNGSGERRGRFPGNVSATLLAVLALSALLPLVSMGGAAEDPARDPAAALASFPAPLRQQIGRVNKPLEFVFENAFDGDVPIDAEALQTAYFAGPGRSAGLSDMEKAAVAGLFSDIAPVLEEFRGALRDCDSAWKAVPSLFDAGSPDCIAEPGGRRREIAERAASTTARLDNLLDMLGGQLSIPVGNYFARAFGVSPETGAAGGKQFLASFEQELAPWRTGMPVLKRRGKLLLLMLDAAERGDEESFLRHAREYDAMDTSR